MKKNLTELIFKNQHNKCKIWRSPFIKNSYEYSKYKISLFLYQKISLFSVNYEPRTFANFQIFEK